MTRSALRLLHYIFTANEHGSFRKAAAVLGVQESAPSRRIHEIEEGLGFPPFVRRHDGAHLAEEGQKYVTQVHPLYEQLTDRAAMTITNGHENGLLQICNSVPAGRGFLFELLDRFRKRKHTCAVELADGLSKVHRTAIVRRQFDIAFMADFCPAKGMPGGNNMGRAPCLPTRGHRLLERNELAWSDFAGESLLVPQCKNGPLLDPCLIERIATHGVRQRYVPPRN